MTTDFFIWHTLVKKCLADFINKHISDFLLFILFMYFLFCGCLSWKSSFLFLQQMFCNSIDFAHLNESYRWARVKNKTKHILDLSFDIILISIDLYVYVYLYCMGLYLFFSFSLSVHCLIIVHFYFLFSLNVCQLFFAFFLLKCLLIINMFYFVLYKREKKKICLFIYV